MEQLKERIQDHYGAAAREAAAGANAGCGCGGGCGCGPGHDANVRDPVTADLYVDGEAADLPEEALLASLGCGNPTALAELHPGDIVLDLGSGGGIDVLLSAKRVAPGGKAYGLDMTPDMLRLARENQRKAGVENAEFLEGEIENVPLPDASVDVIISNCVINLSSDKARALAEAFRVLKPGGRFAVSDIVVRGDIDARVRASAELWLGCVAGALEEREYVGLLESAGFADISIEPTRVYGRDDAEALIAGLGSEAAELADAAADRFMSAFIRARRPQ